MDGQKQLCVEERGRDMCRKNISENIRISHDEKRLA